MSRPHLPHSRLLLAFAVWTGGLGSGWAAGLRQTESFDLRKPPLAHEKRTQVLVLATPHLGSLGERFDPSMLEGLLDALEAYRPDLVAVERLAPGNLIQMQALPGDYAGVAEQFMGEALQAIAAAREALGLDVGAARREAAKTLAELGAQPDDRQRARLALLLLAAGETASAALQWSYLRDPEKAATAEPGPSRVAGFLGSTLGEANEVSSIGIALARRLGLQRLAPIDDHLDKDRFLELAGELTAQLEKTEAMAELAGNAHIAELESRQDEALSDGDLLPLYQWMNSAEYAVGDVEAQFHIFFRTRLPSGLDRVRSALWEVRNLNIASHIRRCSAEHPGGKVLVIIGAGHRPFLEIYLRQMMDIRIVPFQDLLVGR